MPFIPVSCPSPSVWVTMAVLASLWPTRSYAQCPRWATHAAETAGAVWSGQWGTGTVTSLALAWEMSSSGFVPWNPSRKLIRITIDKLKYLQVRAGGHCLLRGGLWLSDKWCLANFLGIKNICCCIFRQKVVWGLCSSYRGARLDHGVHQWWSVLRITVWNPKMYKGKIIKLLRTIYLLIRKIVLLQIKFAMNIPTSARLTKERPMQRPMSPPILEMKDSGDIS